MTPLITYRCPKCGQTIQVRTTKPPTCENPASPWCARRGEVMVVDE